LKNVGIDVFLGRDIERATAPPLNFEGRWFFHFSVEKAEGLFRDAVNSYMSKSGIQ